MRAEQLGRCTAGMWTRTSSDERPLPLRHGHLQELPLREIMFRVNA